MGVLDVRAVVVELVMPLVVVVEQVKLVLMLRRKAKHTMVMMVVMV